MMDELDMKAAKLVAMLEGAAGDQMDEDTAELWDQIERNAQAKIATMRAGEAAVLVEDEDKGMTSATPKATAPLVRVKKLTKFSLSPFGNVFEVTGDQVAVHKKLMMHTSKCESSNIRG